MTQFNQSHYKIMAEGIRLFNAQKYWECHEVLEHHWLSDRGPIRNIYWAVIQVAAAMIHYRDNNIVGATGLINKAKNKFLKCAEENIESALLEEKLSWSKLKNLVNEVPDKPELEDFKLLYEFRFKDC
jgi:predicted metal-dependent hydrolase